MSHDKGMVTDSCSDCNVMSTRDRGEPFPHGTNCPTNEFNLDKGASPEVMAARIAKAQQRIRDLEAANAAQKKLLEEHCVGKTHKCYYENKAAEYFQRAEKAESQVAAIRERLDLQTEAMLRQEDAEKRVFELRGQVAALVAALREIRARFEPGRHLPDSLLDAAVFEAIDRPLRDFSSAAAEHDKRVKEPLRKALQRIADASTSDAISFGLLCEWAESALAADSEGK